MKPEPKGKPSSRTETPGHAFELTGGRLCLDFANTVDNRLDAQPKELLTSYARLVSWARQAGAVTPAEAERLLRKSARQIARAKAVLRRAVGVREAIFRIFSAIVAGREAPSGDLARLNDALEDSLRRLKIGATRRGFAWYWDQRGHQRGDQQATALDGMLWPVVRSAAELLTSSELERVRECASETCGWLFLDHSKNRSRRWCDMKVCGNRSKAWRFYQRRKATASRASHS